jgi:hypothetical protein
MTDPQDPAPTPSLTDLPLKKAAPIYVLVAGHKLMLRWMG